jgi:DNA ligase (NAD+)
VGEHVAGILANALKSFDKLRCAKSDELVAIDGVGPVAAESIVEFFKKDENQKIVDAMISGGIQIFRNDDQKDDQLAGKVFVLTGTLENLTRNEARRIIENAGGKVTGSVSRNTDYLVVGASPGSKLKRAQELGVDIIDEETLKKMSIEDR